MSLESINSPNPKRVPQKQDRMFHIDLGQNDGPFKGAYEHGVALNPAKPTTEEQDTLKVKAEKKDTAENFDTIHSMMQRIQDYTSKALKDLSECKEKETVLREEIVKDIHEVVEKDNSSVLESLQPVIQKDYKSLKQALKQEKEENEQLLKHLLNLRKECATMNLQISACDSKATTLQASLLGEQANVGENQNQEEY